MEIWKEVCDMDISKKLRFVREKLNMTQEELAHALNVTFVSINRWENKKTKPIKIARAAFDSFCEHNNIVFEDVNE